MNIKKFAAVAAVSSALIMGTGIMASAETNSSAAPTFTSAPHGKPAKTADPQKAAKQAAQTQYKADLAAWQLLKTAFDAKAKPVEDAYKAALAAAKKTRDDAIAAITPALPPRPVNPSASTKGNN